MPRTDTVPAPARPHPRQRAHPRAHPRAHSWTVIDRTLAGIALLVPIMLLTWLIATIVRALT